MTQRALFWLATAGVPLCLIASVTNHPLDATRILTASFFFEAAAICAVAAYAVHRAMGQTPVTETNL